ncbi:MAG: tetratricopeptide repeat protein [Chloroflexota bacterium]
MNRPLRLLLGLGLVVVILACSLIPGGTVPPLPFGPTYTPSPTFTPTASPTPTPSPTPIPEVRVESGDHALFNGDYDLARAEYQQALSESTDRAVQAAATWGLARAAYESRDYQTAAVHATALVNQYPEAPEAARAHFLLAQAYTQLGSYPSAASEYGIYLSLRPGVLDAYALELQGDVLFANANYAEALGAYNSASQAPRLDDGILLQIKIAQTRAAIGDYANALTLYDTIFAATTNDYIKAQIDYRAGQAHLELGQTDAAYQRFLHAVENYPLSIYSYNSLVELVNANVPVSDLDRGLVDYFAAQSGATGYDVALAALDRYLEAGLDSDGTARYYRALTLNALGRHEEAIQDFTTFILGYPANSNWTSAWSEKAFTQWAVIGDYQSAAQTLLDFVAVAPSSPVAAEYLFDAARIFERDSRLAEAAQTWERVADEYGGQQAIDSIFLAGITYYRLGDYNRALATFQRGLTIATQKYDQSRFQMWIGKTQEKLGDAAAAQAAWQQAQSLDPTGYYSERARDLLLGRVPFAAPSVVDLDVDLVAERAEAASWVRVTFGLPADTDLSGPGALASDPRFIRGTELWMLGMYGEARLEFESLRKTVESSPTDSFRLANYLLDLGLYRSAIFASRQVLTLAGLDEQTSSLAAPRYFNHVRYGLYYKDLVLPAATENGFDPLFLFSVMRQESLFEGFVRSTAGARGLMQIVPSTGASIAADLGWPVNFQADDLYRPNVSVRLGAHYLAANRALLDGDLYAMLAAYNSGPGNAAVWHELAGGDPDLFLEIVRFAETRDYIRFIAEIYNIYRTIYSPLS